MLSHPGTDQVYILTAAGVDMETLCVVGEEGPPMEMSWRS